MPYVCECGIPFDLIEALDALPTDRMGRSGMFCPSCKDCGRNMEIRLRNGGYEVGYSYFGGSMHFEALQRVGVRGLKISASDPDNLTITVGDRQWHFGIRQHFSSRYCVFPRAFAAGKRVSELDFDQWDVTFTGMVRNNQRLDHDRETKIEPDDFLYLSGPAPALERAWHYINDGISRKIQ